MSTAEHEPASQGAREVSLPAPGTSYNTPESGIGFRHHLRADAKGLVLPDGHHGLV